MADTRPSAEPDLTPDAAAAPRHIRLHADGQRVRLDANGALEAGAVLAGLATHTVPGAERTDPAAGTHERLIHTACGPVAASIQLDAGGALVTLQGAPPSAGEALAAVRAWLDLDTDVALVHDVLAEDPFLAPLLAARPALRVLGTTDAFQTAITTVLGQQVSLAAGRTFAGRLVAAFGKPGPCGLVAFPEPENLASAEPESVRAVVRITGARANTVHAMARAFADARHRPGGRSLPLSRRELLALPGVGPWTADYLEVRTGRRDAFTPGDLVLRRALGGVSPAEASRRAERWRPFRAYALTHLWTATAYSLPE